MRIDIGGVRLYFDVEGAGLVPDGAAMAERPVVVALHGGPGADHSLFKPVLGRATEFAQVVYLDQRGSGRSDVSEPALWTWERWADDVVDFCDALGIDDPVLLGTSSGGWVALTVAHRHPERVRGVVLDSVMPGPAEERLEVFERLGGAEARDIARRYWGGEDVQDDWERVCLPLYSRRPDGDPEARDRLARIRWNRDVIEHFRRSLAGAFDPWPYLERIVRPVLVLNGEDDPVATISAARKLAEALPEGTAELHVLPATGHGVFREDPDRAVALLRDFVGRTAARG
ncbi:alpha/beta fold hydrolase [Actinomadura sp. NPDC000600]|uniref:alpha/beta fold hydrolase n=1 Tax=Actinomadura sp. NPDC000600 TaxID=3154262 RepID=UPI003396DE72